MISKQPHTIDLEDFKIVGDKPINRGAFGIIYLVENRTSKQRFAAKIITTSSSIQRGILISHVRPKFLVELMNLL